MWQTWPLGKPVTNAGSGSIAERIFLLHGHFWKDVSTSCWCLMLCPVVVVWIKVTVFMEGFSQWICPLAATVIRNATIALICQHPLTRNDERGHGRGYLAAGQRSTQALVQHEHQKILRVFGITTLREKPFPEAVSSGHLHKTSCNTNPVQLYFWDQQTKADKMAHSCIRSQPLEEKKDKKKTF